MGDAATHLARADDADRFDLAHYRSRRKGLCGLLFVQCKLKGWGSYVYPTLSQFNTLWQKAAKRLLQLRQGDEKVADQAVIGNLEDRRLLVLVDGDDDLRILHAGKVLDGAGNADGDVEVGGDDLAGLADL